MASEIGVTSSGLEYSQMTPRHTVLSNGMYVRNLPKNTLNGANTIVFDLDPVVNTIHAQECYIVGKVKITKNNGDPLVAADVVALSDNVVGTLFKSVNVTINNTKITNSNVYQTFENYFASRFGIGKNGLDIHVQQLQGLTGEAAGKNDAKNAEATGWTIRKAWTAESKEFEFIGQIPNDFFRSCSQFIPPMQDITIEFKLNDADIVLTGTEAFKFNLKSLELFTRQVSIPASEAMAIYKRQAVKPLHLNFTSLEIQSYTISAGKQVEYIRGIFPHQSPHQLFLVLIETDRINGVTTKDPFKFENAKVEKVVLRQNGTPLMLEAFETDFDNSDAKQAYYFVCQAFDVGHNSRDANLTYEQYLNGATMWAWTLSPDMDANNGVGLLQRPGNYEADIYVKAGTVNPDLTALFIGKFGKTVQIGANNNTVVV